MDNRLKLTDFDILGIITLEDVKGIERYVTKCDNKKYLSRSKEYYNVKTLTELSEEREKLKKLLTREFSKKNFVILENMLNCSAKVYFKKLEQQLATSKNEKLEQEVNLANQCLMEDTENIIKLLEGKGLISIKPKLILPTGEENAEKRIIEMDNKAILYTFAKTLNLENESKNIEILTPGYGSLYIGPFFKAIYGCDYTIMLKSRYIEDMSASTKNKDITSLVSSDRIFKTDKTVFLLDDNVGTGKTMMEIKEKLEEKGIKNCISGAVQFNWRNYYRVATGEKTDIDRFDVNEFEILSPLNYAGHKLYEHAIDRLHSSGYEYIEYLNSKSYRMPEKNDMKGSLDRGILSAERTGLILKDNYTVLDNHFDAEKRNLAQNYEDRKKRKLKPEASKFIEAIISSVENITNIEKETEKARE